MKNHTRKKESIRSFMIVLAGLLCIYIITVNLIRLEAADARETVEEAELYESEEITVTLDTDKIFEEADKKLQSEGISHLVQKLTAGSFLKSAELYDKSGSSGIILSYEADEHEQALTKARKDQAVLINASILMSLYPEIDVVKLEFFRGNEYYEKTIYRPDLEAYFRVALDGRSNKAAFERVAKEFLNAEAVSKYWNMKHPFDSVLGDGVENFFKCKFPAEYNKENYPYVDEEIEKEVVDSYGYKLFIQGLNYDHALMNYYSAYRLIEYYGHSNMDEIILELASCKNRTEEEKVKEACDFAIEVLTAHPSKDEVSVFTRYSETSLKGGRKIFVLKDNSLIELAHWKEAAEGGFEVVSLSPDKKNVFCKVRAAGKVYLYVLPVNEEGTYEVDEAKAVKGEAVIEELTNKIQELNNGYAVTSEEIEATWLFGEVLRVSSNEGKSFIYQYGSWMTEETFNQNYDTPYLIKALEKTYDEVIVSRQAVSGLQIRVSRITVSEETLMVYEYAEEAEKERALNSWKQEDAADDVKSYSKGKIFITYSGNNRQLMSTLENITK